MIYTYKYTVLERDGRIGKETEKIDSAKWLDYLKAHTERYGNLHEFIEAALPAMKVDNPLIAASIASQIEETFGDKEPTAIFQYAMYCWDLFKAGQLSAGAWGAALAFVWHGGERGMLDHVALSEELIVRMFEAADKETLLRVGLSREGWEAYFAELPEHLDIYRGISTGSKQAENGLSWTTNAEEAKRCSARNVQEASEIPGVLHAVVPKSAILAVFEAGDEVVVDPRIAKQQVTTNYLSGVGLTKFRQNWKKWKTAEADKLKEAQKAR